ncbi:unnamed protein product [Colias eurytheme]|nr:unnamed protein product [Colias eurytheme]
MSGRRKGTGRVSREARGECSAQSGRGRAPPPAARTGRRAYCTAASAVARHSPATNRPTAFPPRSPPLPVRTLHYLAPSPVLAWLSNNLRTSAKDAKLCCMKSEAMSDMLSLISELQSERMDEQRAELRPLKGQEAKGASLPGLRPLQTTSTKPEDDFLDMIARVQGSRLEDQRSELPRARPAAPEPDDDFFAQLMKAQSGRLDDQRATIPLQDRQNKAASGSKK